MQTDYYTASLFSRKGRRISGFSLVELMIVVAIISILISVSYPSFKEFQYKAYRASAHSTMGAISTQQQIFRNEFNGYSARFDQIGFNATGNMYFTVGFDDDTPAAVVALYTGTPPTGNQYCRRTCKHPSTGRGAPDECTYVMNYYCHNFGCSGLEATIDSGVTQNTFLLEAHSHLGQPQCGPPYTMDRFETWTMDHNKVLKRYLDDHQ